MTERVKSWRNLTIPPNTKTNIHIHHSIFSSFYSTSLLLTLTSYLPWIRRVGEARFHQFPLPGRSGILWIAICTRIVLLARFFERRNPRNRGRIKYNLETGAPLSLFAVLESIAGGTGHIYQKQLPQGKENNRVPLGFTFPYYFLRQPGLKNRGSSAAVKFRSRSTTPLPSLEGSETFHSLEEEGRGLEKICSRREIFPKWRNIAGDRTLTLRTCAR